MSISPPAMRRSHLLERLAGGAPIRVPVVLVTAHPDDEVIGLGARLHVLERLTLVHVTDGAPRDLRDARAHGFETAAAYAEARRLEMDEALSVAGSSPERVVEFGIPDQEASEHLVEIARRLATLLGEAAPELVLTHAYEGGHPDHDAIAFAVHAAAELSGYRAELGEFTSYHRAHGRLESGVFLPSAESHVYSAFLTAAEERHKQLLFDTFVTQRETLACFRTDVEQFRLAPAYDFTVPPHPGPVHYEQYGWGGMTAERFCERAAAALRELHLGAAA